MPFAFCTEDDTKAEALRRGLSTFYDSPEGYEAFSEENLKPECWHYAVDWASLWDTQCALPSGWQLERLRIPAHGRMNRFRERCLLLFVRIRRRPRASAASGAPPS
jgi:uncharacterized protein YbdZ (MbtH family)